MWSALTPILEKGWSWKGNTFSQTTFSVFISQTAHVLLVGKVTYVLNTKASMNVVLPKVMKKYVERMIVQIDPFY